MSTGPLVLVDGSSYLHRAFRALPELTAPDGTPTNAMHGVLNMINRLVKDFGPDHIAVVFDARGKTFRNDLYEEYKANRPPMPEALRCQIEPTIAAIEALGIRVLRVPDVEADDVIGTLATEAAENATDTVISTTDKDMTQLVSDHVLVLNTMDDRRLDEAGVREKFGVAPGQIVDYLTLIGDSSDNIPGVPGVGPKTAMKWLETYGSLDSLLEHADEIGGKVGERLRDALPRLPLYKTLVTIKCDVELPVGIADLVRGEIDAEKLRALLEPLGMETFLRRMLGDPGTNETEETQRQTHYEIVLSEAQLDEWIDRLGKAPLVSLDTETTGLDYMAARLVGISLAVEPYSAAYIPLAHRYPGAPDQLDLDAVVERLRSWLEDPTRPKVGHHLKYDAHIFKNHRIRLAGIAYDTMLESYVLNSTATRHDMDSVAAKYLGARTTKYEDVAGKGAKQLSFDEVEIEVAGSYAAEDADITLRLHERLWPELEAVPELATLYLTLEQPLIRVLQKMEHTGVMIDARLLEQQGRELAATMEDVKQAAYEAAGGPFNLGSPKQLQEVLYERLGLPMLGKTPKGQPSTAESVLQDLAEDYELPSLVLEYRRLAKLKSTYTDKLPRAINPDTGRVHTSYHQAVAATGRLSSSDPNLQNIPIRRPEGRRIRQAFVAPPGCMLIAADYSQIELRIMAHLSGDEGLLDAFLADQDIHRATAAEVFGAELDDVTSEQRRSAKAINFGLIYGMSAFGLARQLGIERGEAQAYVDLYFDRYPGVLDYMERTRALAREQGFVSTVFGRRLYLSEINARNPQRRQYAERSAINAPMQGTAADIIKRAMLAIDGWIEADAAPARLLMQVHDELVLEVSAGHVDATADRVAGLMEQAADLSVPLKVDVGTGANWDEAH